MNNSDLLPQIRRLKAVGIFSSKEFKFESHFEVIHFPQNTIIRTEIKGNSSNHLAFAAIDGSWSLKGLTTENSNIFAKNLLFTNLTGNRLTMCSFKDFTINKSELDSFTSAEYSLVGLYKGNFSTKKETTW